MTCHNHFGVRPGIELKYQRTFSTTPQDAYLRGPWMGVAGKSWINGPQTQGIKLARTKLISRNTTTKPIKMKNNPGKPWRPPGGRRREELSSCEPRHAAPKTG